VTASPVAPITSIMVGQRCIGFAMRRGAAGVEGFDEYSSLGLYDDQAEAIAAVAAAASRPTQEEHPPCELEISTDGVQRR
jgi:hypothetical protein